MSFIIFQDQRNVLRPPPSGVPFYFNFQHSYPVAMAILAEDTHLQKLRFELVPKKYKANICCILLRYTTQRACLLYVHYVVMVSTLSFMGTI